MLIKIGKVTYDTNKSQIVKKNTFSYYGDPAGYEETLYVTERGNYYLYTYGGITSPYKKEKIKPLSKVNAKIQLEKM
jgi:hypothetical protein